MNECTLCTRSRHARRRLPRPTTNGWLFLTSGTSIEVVDGAAIQLGGKRWVAQLTDDGPLELSCATISDNGFECVAERMDNVAHELVQRRAEIEALKLQQKILLAEMEEVPFCMLSAHACSKVVHSVLHT